MPDHHIVQRGQVRKQVELLEDHADALAHLVLVDLGRRDLLLFQPDAAAVGRAEQVDAAQERALARAAGADQHDYLARVDRRAKRL